MKNNQLKLNLKNMFLNVSKKVHVTQESLLGFTNIFAALEKHINLQMNILKLFEKKNSDLNIPDAEQSSKQEIKEEYSTGL